MLPSEAELARARKDVAALELPRLAAQLVVPRQEGTGAAAADVIRSHHVGGVTAFGNVIPGNPAQVRSVVNASNQAVHAAVRADGRDWPAFVAIDQEGGEVNRIGAPLTRFPSLMALGATHDPAVIERVGAKVGLVSGSQLRALGFSVVLAPSADVTAGPIDPTIGTRSAGSDPAVVSGVAKALLTGYRQAGIVSTLKHFPGHGGIAGDSHLGVARQSAPLATLRARDLRPFAELAPATPAVMVGHIELSALDSANPATLSPRVVNGLLRTTQRFGGLVVTDALEMKAITERYGAGEAAVRAVEAGCDVLLIPASTPVAIQALVDAVRSGRLTRQRLEESAARMVATLRHAQAVAPVTVGAQEADAVARDLAVASITQLSGRCGTRLVGRGITITGGSTADQRAFSAAARAAGLAVAASPSNTTVHLTSDAGYRAGAAAVAATSGRAAAPGARAAASIVVALDRPYPLASARSGTTLIATFGRTPATFAALTDVLVGRRAAGGRLPVAVGRYPVGSGCR